jgi:hypothetical protein
MNKARMHFHITCGCGARFGFNEYLYDPTSVVDAVLGRPRTLLDMPGLVLEAAMEHAERAGHGMDFSGVITAVKSLPKVIPDRPWRKDQVQEKRA